MNGGWVGPTSLNKPKTNNSNKNQNNNKKKNGTNKQNNKVKDDNNNTNHSMVMSYRALVVDSGPIIRRTGLTNLRGKAKEFYTVPAVIQEIRDAKAREQLDQLPFELIPREPSSDGIQAVVEFARKTGDYQTLSTVDLQVLGLLYDLEKEGCNGDVSHIRTEPKRTVGLGKFQSLSEGKKEEKKEDDDNNKTISSNVGKQEETARKDHVATTATDGKSIFETPAIEIEDYDEEIEEEEERDDDDFEGIYEESKEERGENQINVSTTEEIKQQAQPTASIPTASTPAPKSWASLVNPAAATASPPSIVIEQQQQQQQQQPPKVADKALDISFGQMNLLDQTMTKINHYSQEDDGGQFSDAEEDDADPLLEAATGRGTEKQTGILTDSSLLEAELQSDFPSLQASLTVPYEGSDDEGVDTTVGHDNGNGSGIAVPLTKEEQEKRKQESLRPISKSGKLYNSFRKYGNLMKPKPVIVKSEVTNQDEDEEEVEQGKISGTGNDSIVEENQGEKQNIQSRIIGGMGMAGQEDEVEDDGEGWITCTSDINKMKAAGVLDPLRNPNDKLGDSNDPNSELPISKRTACATTDFAMQNVILQMNLELLSVDGIKIRRLKSWVTRCGACFKVYADGNNSEGPNGMKRLFCSHCGSDMMQRIAASVDGKTGRLRLHLSKKYKNNLRGTKFSLPKAGTGNRFQGDLLLREDQLMMGAWNQKVKMRSGGKSRAAAQSIFGKDLASNVGCNPKAISHDDIQVGFGRRNPNAAKGRERKGKKKKSSDRACGLRRY